MLLSLIGAMLLPGSHTESLTAFDTELPKSDYLEASITSVAPPSHGFTRLHTRHPITITHCSVLRRSVFNCIACIWAFCSVVLSLPEFLFIAIKV